MPHTNPWSDTDPPGSQAANTIDDEIRQLRLDIHERMDDIVVDWTADPIVLAGAGAVVSSKRATYQDSLSAGSKVSALADIQGMMFVVLTGTTNSSGVITFNFNEINTGSGGTLNYQVSNGAGVAFWRGNRSSDGVPVFIRVIGSSGVTNTVTLEFRYGDGAIVSSLPVAGTLLVLSQSNPVV